MAIGEQIGALLLRRWRRELGAQVEQLVLNDRQHRVEPARVAAPRQLGPDDAEHRVQLIDRAVGFDPVMVLRDPLPPKECGFALIAGSRVDFHIDSRGFSRVGLARVCQRIVGKTTTGANLGRG